MRYRYVLIAGHGRSGTNWLLDILDASAHTHCRNEPNELAGSPFAALPSAWVPAEDPQAFAPLWQRAVAWSAARAGTRDRAAACPKAHQRFGAGRRGLLGLMSRPRVRRVAAALWPALREEEWSVPSFCLRDHVDFLPVLKCNQVPGWAAFVLDHEADALVVHIVRHPAGFLRSWRRRYVAKRDSDGVLAANRARLREVAAAGLLPEGVAARIDGMGLDESELWFWRVAAEQIHAAGRERANYHLVLYDELAAEPEVGARALLEAAGLPWGEAEQRRIRAASGRSVAVSRRWREELGDDEARLIRRILDGSTLASWWEDPVPG